MTKLLELRLGPTVQSTPISQIRQAELDDRTVTVKRYGAGITKMASSAKVRLVGKVGPDFHLGVDRDEGTIYVIGLTKSFQPPRLDEKNAFDLVAKVLDETGAITKELHFEVKESRTVAKVLDETDATTKRQSERVWAAGCFLYESLTGSEPTPVAGRKNYFDVATAIPSQVTGRVIGNMIAPAERRYSLESAAAIVRELAYAEPQPDPEPDPGDRTLFVELTHKLAPITSKLIRATAITDPSRELAQQWLAESQRMLNELAGGALTPEISSELTRLAEHLATTSLDDPEYVAERGQGLAGALLANWASTLGELVLEDPMIPLQEHLWPPQLPEPHATEYCELLEQYALTPQAVVPVWREFGETVKQSLDLPNRLRLLRLDAAAFAVFSPMRRSQPDA